jgi:hypothetical protein
MHAKDSVDSFESLRVEGLFKNIEFLLMNKLGEYITAG